MPSAIKIKNRKDGKTETVLLHRFITNCPFGKQVDHVSGDTLDNRRENLRFCTHAENTRNAQKRKDNKSGFKGVSWQGQKKKWRACISVNSKNKHLGLFTTAEAAHEAYVVASQKYHGEFGRLV
jgi:hypothetical protein